MGEGCDETGPVSNKKLRHYLRQFDSRFAKDIIFVMRMAETIQRHETLREASIRAVPGENGKFKELCDLANSPDFAKILQSAVDDPTSSAAKKLTSKLEHLVHLGQRNVRWSAAQRKALIAEIYAYVNYFGTCLHSSSPFFSSSAYVVTVESMN